MAITPEVPGQINPPNTLTGEAVGVVAAPNTLTGEAVGTVAAPNTLTGEAVGTVSAPNTLTANAAGSVSAPNTLVGEAVGSVSAPNTLTANAAGSVSAPNTLTGKAVGSVSAPNTLVGVTPAAFPRTLTPLVDMNFATRSYAQSGTPVTFDDLFTYSRASSATFTNRVAKATGGYDYFLDTDYVGDVTNLLTYSEQFDNAEWNKLNSNITANATENHLGATIADKLIVDSTVAASHYVDNAFTVSSGAVATLSIYVKAAELNWVLLYEVGNNSGFYFNIKAGLIGVIKGSGARGAFIKDAGDGWYNIGFTITAPAATVEFRLFLAEANNDNVINGDGVSGVYMWGAQLTESVKPLPYVKTLNAPVTQTFTETLRTEYDPATGEALGALIEGGSTNLALWSEDFHTTPWRSETSILTNTAIAPDGTLSADTLIPNVSGNSTTLGNASTNNRMFQNISGTYTNVTNSIYVKSVSGSGSSFSIYVQIGDNIRAINTVTVTSNWQRVEVSAILSSETPRFTICTEESVYIWGAQVEALPFATSYIRTEGAAVSRSADNLSVSPYAAINPSELSYNVVFNSKTSGEHYPMILRHTALNSKQFWVYIDPDARLISGISVISSVTATGVFVPNETFNISGTYNGTVSNLYKDNELLAQGASSAPIEINGANPLFIGSNGGSQPLFGHISKFATYDKALTAQEITLL